ncbi:MAG: CPBP family intramembrane metalloprotease [Chloroflexi bacterium]|nr:MAG: CPBP family intramembrane metalloprotease [Chloroflexota bacterium]MBL1194544.1 CPBP family intramembrane metalloprotease [Chloroflexota bacterium]NOH11832.1 CPBP family intramembrane metalloprotease [Chloroflexota bacterium]
MSENSPARPIWYYPAYIFWNFAERRLRFVWRLGGFILLFSIISSIVSILLFFIVGEDPPPFLIQSQFNLYAFLAVLLAVRWFDRRKFSDTGIYFDKNWWIDLGFGSLLGALLMAAIFLIQLTAGWVNISDTFVSPGSVPFALAILVPLLVYVGVSLTEELLFRGYLLLNLAEGLKSRFINPRLAIVLAWVLTSALFGIAHATNPEASTISSLNIAVAGIFIGLAYVLTGSLAIPLGIHLTWNFFQGNVFGFPVSGTNNFSTTVFAIEQRGPLAWTGGAFGPEAGIIGLLAMLAGSLLTLWWLRWRYGKIGLHTAIAEAPQRSA